MSLEPAVETLAVTKTGHVGVIGTRGMTKRQFGKLMASLADQAHFVVQPCDGLAHAIERSVATPPLTLTALSIPRRPGALCERFVQAMGSFGTGPGQMDTLVLGCTLHFCGPRVARTGGAGGSVHRDG